MPSIPASAIVSVNPNVISAGGTGLELSALVLTTSNRVPIGTALSFASATDVANFFGPTSDEQAFSNVYFSGYTNSNIRPGAILFAQFTQAATGGYIRGGNVALTLTQLQALTGSLIFVVAGSTVTAASINLSAATSFSNAAAILTAGFTTPGFAITYDSIAGGFVVTNTATGTSSTLTYATGTLAASLGLTLATGAALSQGAVVLAPGAYMTQLTQTVTNWATLATIFNPDSSGQNTQKMAFATWVSQSNDRYCYVAWDGDVTATTSNMATASMGYLLGQSQQSGTIMVWDQGYVTAAFICGWVASLDFTELNGRSTLAFKSQAGLTATVTNQTAAANLIANGYNFYGSYATAAEGFVFLYPGSCSGPFEWADSYINQIWLNNALQLALMTLLTQVKSVPYNPLGYGLIRAACMDPVQQAVNYGAIRTGVPLSDLQTAEVNAAAGVAIDKALFNNGFYLQVLPATAQSRAARSTPPCSLYYMDGGSVQNISLASIEIQ